MREIILDTETTGFSPATGDKIVEIGCVEMIDGVITGNNYHQYINPQRESSAGALRVHGLSSEFLAKKPVFKDIATEFLEYIKDSSLVIHNASFDMKFLNHELKLIKKKFLPNNIIDTLVLAKKKFPGEKVNLDSLCRKLKVDGSKRIKHGALLDAELLAEVYIELNGGKQITFDFGASEKKIEKTEVVLFSYREFKLKPEEEQAHQEMLKKIANHKW